MSEIDRARRRVAATKITEQERLRNEKAAEQARQEQIDSQYQPVKLVLQQRNRDFLTEHAPDRLLAIIEDSFKDVGSSHKDRQPYCVYGKTKIGMDGECVKPTQKERVILELQTGNFPQQPMHATIQHHKKKNTGRYSGTAFADEYRCESLAFQISPKSVVFTCGGGGGKEFGKTNESLDELAEHIAEAINRQDHIYTFESGSYFDDLSLH